MIDYEATIAMLKAKADQRVSDITSMAKEYKRLLAMRDSGKSESGDMDLVTTQKAKVASMLAEIEAKVAKAAGVDVVNVDKPVVEEIEII